MAKDNKRLLSLDILRGITIAGMLLVNNPGSWSYLYRPLAHADWIGLSPTDLVFPFFVFCMGVSMAFSLKKFNYKMSKPLLWKIVRRTVILFLIGWVVQWLRWSISSGHCAPCCSSASSSLGLWASFWWPMR